MCILICPTAQALAIGKWIVRKARVDGKRVQDEDPEETGTQACSRFDLIHA